MEKKDMKVYEVILDETNFNSGVNAISLVSSPAMELDFIALSKEKEESKNIALASEERQVLMGAALIPNKPIYRRIDEDEFYIVFSKDTIRRASELYFIRNNQNRATLEHETDLSGLTTVESWIVEDTEMDKSKKYGFSVPLGTWMVSMKVENNDTWNSIVKSGKVSGFSIEGFFVPELRENLSKIENKNEYELALNEVKKILGLI